MENYSKLLIDNEQMINGKKFTYNIKTKEFKFEITPKNFDLEIFKSFTPKLNDNNDFRARLENEIYKLKEWYYEN